MKKNDLISVPFTKYSKIAPRSAALFVSLFLVLSLIACNGPAGPAGQTGNTGAPLIQVPQDRAPVTVPLQSGLKVIDALIPIGRGQRELILGDRQTGKTTIAIDTILNQRDHNVLCVYCAIGQRASAVAKAVATLREKGAMEYTVLVVTEGNDPPGLTYIAEHFMEAGRDVLIVYDDLTHHAPAPTANSRSCWNGPHTCARNSATARSPPCPSSRPRRRTFPPIFRPT